MSARGMTGRRIVIVLASAALVAALAILTVHVVVPGPETPQKANGRPSEAGGTGGGAGVPDGEIRQRTASASHVSSLRGAERKPRPTPDGAGAEPAAATGEPPAGKEARNEAGPDEMRMQDDSSPEKAGEPIQTRPIRLSLEVIVRGTLGMRKLFPGEEAEISVTLGNENVQSELRDFSIRERDAISEAIDKGRRPEKMTHVTPAALVLRLPQRDYGWVGALALRIYMLRDGAAEKEERLADTDWRALLSRDRAFYEGDRELGERFLGASWVLPPETTQRLEPGRYEVSVAFDTSWLENIEGGGKGVSASGRFEIVALPTDPAGRLLYTYLQAGYALRRKDYDSAIKFAGEILAADPGFRNYVAYYFLGRAYEEQGMSREALAAYESFLSQVKDNGISMLPNRIRHKVEVLRQELGPAP